MDAAQRPRRVAKRRRKPVGDAEEKKADNVAAAPMAIEVEDEPARLPEIAAEEPEAASSRGKRVAKRRRKEAEPPADESDSGQKVSAEETTGTWWEGAQQLEERFAGLDMTLLCNRKGPTLFPDAQQGVQTLSQRPFSLSHLAQIKTIYPEAYTLEVRKTHPKEKLLHPSCGPYVLTLALPPGAKPVERKATFHERLVAFKAEGGIASSSTFEVPLSPLPEVPTAASLAQAKSAKSSHNAATERDQSAPASATEHDEIKTNNTAGETKAKYQSNTKEGRAERYAAVLRRVKEREAKLAAAGSAEEQKEAFLLKSLPQLNLVLRSLFVVKKFKPIPLDEALVQLCSSYRDAFGLSVEKQDVERRLKMLNELMPDMLQTKEGMDHNVFLVLPRGPIPGDRLQAAIDAKQEQQQPHDQKMAIDAAVSKA